MTRNQQQHDLGLFILNQKEEVLISKLCLIADIFRIPVISNPNNLYLTTVAKTHANLVIAFELL
ncbi:hypothetical protein PtB15_17B440 [Puccinia triticina]|nr:hypothetical protein PtB15_17B440 [Puccinia triticina]